jgi:type II secretory pathway pseudopilin PulG
MVRRGITLIELVVVVSVVGLLTTLLLPAVQRSRETARRTQCLNNLHQIGVAIASFESTNGYFPVPTGPPGDSWAISAQARLLNHLGYESLYASIDFESVPAARSNHTAMLSHVALFVCPSDPRTPLEGPRNNYRFNGGSGPYWLALRTIRSGDGIFHVLGRTAPRDVIDGLSHTAIVSERVVGSGAGRFAPERDFSRLPIFPAVSADEYFRICAEHFGKPFLQSGSHWLPGGPEWTWYNHVATPNNAVPDCGEDGELPRPGMFTARSWHPSGVNVLSADGSARFLHDNIDLAAWRALATRAGGETSERLMNN